MSKKTFVFESSFRENFHVPSIILFSLILVLSSCKDSKTQKESNPRDASASSTTIRFTDVLDKAGIDFEHYGERHRWCEIGPEVQGIATNEEILMSLFDDPFEFAERHLIRMNGSGAAWFDYDNDNDWDLYLVNGAGGPNVTNALYENNGDGTFTVQLALSGVLDTGEGMGVSAADYNNDGYPDLFITNFGNFVLYKNNGDRTFTDVTQSAFENVPDRWYGGSAWGDFDKDGLLDLYVCGYVDLSKRPENTDLRFPMDFEGFPNRLYRNNGDGSFTDVTKQANVGDAFRKSMQVLIADFNDDSWPDILVANDTDPNSLYLNRGDWTFKEFSGPSGISSTDGSMGIAYGDYNNDGKNDIFISNYTGEADLLLKLVDNQSSNDGILKNVIYNGDFSSPVLMQRTWGKVGWGTGFFDFDNDSDLDLFIANGHLNAVSGDNRDENLLFENDGTGGFTDISLSSGINNAGKRIHRSAIFADYDNDGLVDIYVVNNGEKSYDSEEDRKGILLKNNSKNTNSWINIRLQGVKSNRDGFGTKVRIVTGNIVQVSELVSGAGYFSTNAKELHFGLGQANKIDLIEVKWPSGIVQTYKNIDPNQSILFIESSDDYQLLALSESIQ
ncbi:MAG: CRTAC1 family protein [Bacteroidetes bacterium]|nr:CRTAC1 family protein [Bacteroidota bacterium]